MFRRRRVYADAAASTPLSRRARREMLRLLGVYGNPGALHSEAIAAKAELERARARVAAAIHAHADEIVFVSSGTEANNLALGGVLASQESPAHAITSAIEHASVLGPLRAADVELTEVGTDAEGLVFPNAVVSAIKPNTMLVSVQLVNSEVGTIEPVREIAQGLRRAKHKIYFHTDASQAPLWMNIDVEKLGVDLMTLDGQKILGPKGVGCLFVRRGTPLSPVMLGGGQERGLRSGTENIALAGAFAVALEDAQARAAKNTQQAAGVRDFLWAEIQKQIPGAALNGPSFANRAPNNLNISIPGLDAQMAVLSMDALGVAVSTRSACSAGQEEPSHVIKALGTPAELVGTALRITLLPGAKRGEARRLVRSLVETAARYRKTGFLE
jgi:cysteine desulfurase